MAKFQFMQDQETDKALVLLIDQHMMMMGIKSYRKVADLCKIAPDTLYKRIRKGNFDQKELRKLRDGLRIPADEIRKVAL